MSIKSWVSNVNSIQFEQYLWIIKGVPLYLKISNEMFSVGVQNWVHAYKELEREKSGRELLFCNLSRGIQTSKDTGESAKADYATLLSLTKDNGETFICIN